MKKLLPALLLCLVISGCVVVPVQEDKKDYRLTKAYDKDTEYKYILLEECNLKERDHEISEKVISKGYPDFDTNKLVEDIKNTSTEDILKTMTKVQDIVITKNGEENAFVYRDENNAPVFVIRDDKKNLQLYNSIDLIPERYEELIEKNKNMIFTDVKINNEDKDKCLLSFANPEMIIISGTGTTNSIIYSPSYYDMDVVCENTPIKVDYYIDGDNIIKYTVTLLSKKDEKPSLSDKDISMLESIPNYGTQIAQITKQAVENTQNAKGKNVNANWEYFYNISHMEDFYINIINIDV